MKTEDHLSELAAILAIGIASLFILLFTIIIHT